MDPTPYVIISKVKLNAQVGPDSAMLSVVNLEITHFSTYPSVEEAVAADNADTVPPLGLRATIVRGEVFIEPPESYREPLPGQDLRLLRSVLAGRTGSLPNWGATMRTVGQYPPPDPAHPTA